MSMDPNKWLNTIPFIETKSNQKKYKLDSDRWVNTLPGKDDNTSILKDDKDDKDDNALIVSNAINSKPKSSPVKKYSFANRDMFSGEVITSCSRTV